MTSLTINPEDVRAATGPADAQPRWLEEVVDYVRRAAADGETVTLTARRRMLTPEQVAELTGMSRSTISRRIKNGELRAVKVGNRNRVPYEEFERYWRELMGDMVEAIRDDLEEDLFGVR